MTMPGFGGFGPIGPELSQLRRLQLLGSGTASAQGAPVPSPNLGLPTAGPEPKSWGDAFRERLLGPQGSALPEQYQRSALMQGLLQGAAALDGPGGAGANWGRALLAGVAGLDQGVEQGRERARLDEYRASLERDLEGATDPIERQRLQYMLLNADRFISPQTDAPVKPELRPIPDPSDPTGRRWAWGFIFPDGQIFPLHEWATRQQSDGSGRDPTSKIVIHEQTMAARREIEAGLQAGEYESRDDVELMDPELAKAARRRSPLETTESYENEMRQWRAVPPLRQVDDDGEEEPPAKGGSSLLQRVFPGVFGDSNDMREDLREQIRRERERRRAGQ